MKCAGGSARCRRYVRVANPIAADQNLLRNSLVPGIWKNVLDNAKHFDSFRLFEIGHEIHRRESGLPHEIPHLTAAIYAKAGDGQRRLIRAEARGRVPYDSDYGGGGRGAALRASRPHGKADAWRNRSGTAVRVSSVTGGDRPCRRSGH